MFWFNLLIQTQFAGKQNIRNMTCLRVLQWSPSLMSDHKQKIDLSLINSEMRLI